VKTVDATLRRTGEHPRTGIGRMQNPVVDEQWEFVIEETWLTPSFGEWENTACIGSRSPAGEYLLAIQQSISARIFCTSF